jgi:hypothetical protein
MIVLPFFDVLSSLKEESNKIISKHKCVLYKTLMRSLKEGKLFGDFGKDGKLILN